MLVIARPRGGLLREALRLLPDLLRLLPRLAADRRPPRGVRAGLALLLAYLAFPVDLVPAFIPVLGYADDAIIVAAGPCAGRAWRRSAASGQAPTSAADCASRDLPTRTQVTHNSPRANGGAKSSRGRCSCSLPPVRAADIHPASATVKQRSGGILPRWLARE